MSKKIKEDENDMAVLYCALVLSEGGFFRAKDCGFVLQCAARKMIEYIQDPKNNNKEQLLVAALFDSFPIARKKGINTLDEYLHRTGKAGKTDKSGKIFDDLEHYDSDNEE